jgi:hypothetical protein
MVVKDMGQLAQYLAALCGTGEITAENVGVGFLLDECHFRVAFSPFSLQGVTLPVIILSQIMRWRDGSSISQGVWCMHHHVPAAATNYAASACIAAGYGKVHREERG